MSPENRLRAIQALQPQAKILNVCGGHERSITEAGLRTALPAGLELIPGPGCPVCVCPEEDLFGAIQIALDHPITLVAFGDMLRVPINGPKDRPRSLEQAKAAGADIRPIASPREAVLLARADVDRKIVFFAAGFETTMAPVAAMIAEGIPENLFLLLSGRLTWPIVDLLLRQGAEFGALIAPGHVATVMGAEEWRFVADTYQVPVAVAGFTPDSLLAAFYSVLRQQREKKVFLDNCYPQVVTADGNPGARKLLAQTLRVVDANWRGIGEVPASGYALAEAYEKHDARQTFPDAFDPSRRRAGEMPPGCQCAEVVMGKLPPNQCRLYGKSCTPHAPVGPCMVSDEGACRIWWSGGLRP